MKKWIWAPLLLVISLLLGCEKDDPQLLEHNSVETVSPTPDFEVQSFSYENLPDFVDIVASDAKSSKVAWASKNNSDEISIDKDNIIVVVDSVGNKTYSALLQVPTSPYNVFYNVVAKRNAEGVFNEPFVLRYEVDEDYYGTYVQNNREDAPFKGSLEVYSLNSILGNSSSSGKAVFNEEPCETHEVGTKNTPKKGGNRPPNGTRPKTTPGLTTPTVVPVTTPGKPRRKPSVEVGTGTFGAPETEDCDSETANLACKQQRASKVVSDCPEEQLLVPINEEKLKPPSCKSFNYKQGLENTQTAAVKNVSFRVRFLDPNTGNYRASDVVFNQPIYFTIPRYHTMEGNLTTGRGANLSAKALLNAHSRATAYFLATDGSESQVRAKLWEYIRDEFRNGANLNGGVASFNPPLGGFSGPVTNYVTTTFFSDRCD